MKRKDIVEKVDTVLNKIIRDNIRSLMDNNPIVRPGYGYNEFYLNHVMEPTRTVQGLIHYILFEEKIYEQILTPVQYTSCIKTIDEDPEGIYWPGDGSDEDIAVRKLLEKVYVQCSAFVARELTKEGYKVFEEFSQFFDKMEHRKPKKKIEPVTDKDKFKKGRFFDKRGEVNYKTVMIDEQIWFARNLNACTFLNGDPVPEAKTDKEWQNAGNSGKPAWCYYENNVRSEKRYGKLYNWFAVTDPRGLAPEGWRIPEDIEWTVLISMLGGEGKCEFMLNEAGATGFSGTSAGYRNDDGEFLPMPTPGSGTFWSSTKIDDENIAGRYIDGLLGLVTRMPDLDPRNGYSVRCLKYLERKKRVRRY
jgi:uncharacterized protein (TIGR02145 family)